MPCTTMFAKTIFKLPVFATTWFDESKRIKYFDKRTFIETVSLKLCQHNWDERIFRTSAEAVKQSKHSKH